MIYTTQNMKYRGNNFPRREFIMTRLEKLIGVHVKLNKYLCKIFKVRLVFIKNELNLLIRFCASLKIS